MKHIARKRFGQHFLSDQSVIAAIVDAINPQPAQPMVEIGPGLAALTQPLVERLGHLTVIELDRDLAARLRTRAQLRVVESDVLRVDFAALARDVGAPKLRVVGNLPYNISTPILFHLLAHVDVVQDQHFMLQKEVIDRMVAMPATADYGRLSVMLQWRYDMENVLFVPPDAFEPPPRVDSAVVRVISLFYLGQWNTAVFNFAHEFLWQGLIMLDVLIVWLLWVRAGAKAQKIGEPPPPSEKPPVLPRWVAESKVERVRGEVSSSLDLSPPQKPLV